MSSTRSNLIPNEFYAVNSEENDSSDSDSVKYNPKPQPPRTQAQTVGISDIDTFCPVTTHLEGRNFSKNCQVEYRVQIHPNRTVILQEQTIYSIETNVEISNMNSFCMFLQTNKEDSFCNEYKLFTQGFISPFFTGTLVVNIKNIEAYTKVLYPTDVIGYLTIQPFIFKPEDIFSTSI